MGRRAKRDALYEAERERLEGAVEAVEEELRQLQARAGEVAAAVRRLNATIDLIPSLRPPVSHA